MRYIKMIMLPIFGLVSILLVLVLSQSVTPEQMDDQLAVHVFPDTLDVSSLDVDSLRNIVGSNKGLPKGFELAALVAYSSYPELKDVRIDMELTLSGAPMESSFDIMTLFGSGKNRIYKIYLNDGVDTPFDEILLRALPFDAQVGILAHELGHVAYYHKLNTLQIGKWGLEYLLDGEFRAIHERTTDLMPVYHGLGSQIWQYAWFVRYDPSCAPLYKSFGSFMDQYYMTDVELMESITTHRLYETFKRDF